MEAKRSRSRSPVRQYVLDANGLDKDNMDRERELYSPSRLLEEHEEARRQKRMQELLSYVDETKMENTLKTLRAEFKRKYQSQDSKFSERSDKFERAREYTRIKGLERGIKLENGTATENDRALLIADAIPDLDLSVDLDVSGVVESLDGISTTLSESQEMIQNGLNQLNQTMERLNNNMNRIANALELLISKK